MRAEKIGLRKFIQSILADVDRLSADSSDRKNEVRFHFKLHSLDYMLFFKTLSHFQKKRKNQ
jgi:hypothetical protein